MTSQPALNALNFFMADVRDGLGPFLGVYLQSKNWSPAEIGLVMTIGGEHRLGSGKPIDVVQPHRKNSVLGTMQNATAADVSSR